METSSDPKKLPSPVKIALKWGLVAGIAIIIYGMILYFAGMSTNQSAQWFSYILLGIGIYLGAREHRDKQLGGYMSYGRALGAGVLICLFAAILTGLFNYVFFTLNTDALEEIKTQQEQQIYEQGLPREQEEMSLKMVSKMMTPAMLLVFVIPGMTFFGLILSLIIAAFLKKDRPLHIEEEEGESDVR